VADCGDAVQIRALNSFAIAGVGKGTVLSATPAPGLTFVTEKTSRVHALTPASHGARAARGLCPVADVADGSDPLIDYSKKEMPAKPQNASRPESISDSK